MRIQELKKCVALLLFLGFVGGIIFTNFCLVDYVAEMGILTNIFVDNYRTTQINLMEYAFYLIKMRVLCFVCLLVCSGTKVKNLCFFIFSLWTGFGLGIIFTSASIKMGLRGIIFCILTLMPHYPLYWMGFLIIFNNGNAINKEGMDIVKIVAVGFLLMAGIILEALVNPVIVQFATGTIHT